MITKDMAANLIFAFFMGFCIGNFFNIVDTFFQEKEDANL